MDTFAVPGAALYPASVTYRPSTERDRPPSATAVPDNVSAALPAADGAVGRAMARMKTPLRSYSSRNAAVAALVSAPAPVPTRTTNSVVGHGAAPVWQARRPSQAPLVPQLVAASSAHSWSGSLSAGTGAQTPSAAPVFAAEQASQIPTQAFWQQTPSVQKPEAHWLAAAHACPAPRVPTPLHT